MNVPHKAARGRACRRKLDFKQGSQETVRALSPCEGSVWLDILRSVSVFSSHLLTTWSSAVMISSDGWRCYASEVADIKDGCPSVPPSGDDDDIVTIISVWLSCHYLVLGKRVPLTCIQVHMSCWSAFVPHFVRPHRHDRKQAVSRRTERADVPRPGDSCQSCHCSTQNIVPAHPDHV
jgi:hypothetical protein